MYFILSILLSSRYVKVYLLPDRSKSGKRKTKVKKHTINPVFDEVLKVCGYATNILPYTCFIIKESMNAEVCNKHHLDFSFTCLWMRLSVEHCG